MRNFVQKLVEKVDAITNFLSSIFMAATFVLVFFNVVLRYCFNSGFAWSEEGARYMFVCMVFMGFISVTEKRQHFKVTILTDKLHGIPATFVAVLQNVIICALLYIIGIGAVDMAKLNWHNKSPAIGLPVWILYGVMAFSSFAMLLVSLINIWNDIAGYSKNESKEE